MGAGGLIALASVLGAVALVAALALVFVRFLSRLPGGPSGGGGAPLKFLRSLPVGQRERVTLVSYRGEVFMLGVAQGSVTLLARMEGEPEAANEAPPAAPWLAGQFKEAMRRARKNEAPEPDDEVRTTG